MLNTAAASAAVAVRSQVARVQAVVPSASAPQQTPQQGACCCAASAPQQTPQAACSWAVSRPQTLQAACLAEALQGLRLHTDQQQSTTHPWNHSSFVVMSASIPIHAAVQLWCSFLKRAGFFDKTGFCRGT
jgi:hypothetical protein